MADDASKCAAHIGLYLLILITAGLGGAALLVGIFLGNMSADWDPLRRHSAALLMLTVSLFVSAYINYRYAYTERKEAAFMSPEEFKEKKGTLKDSGLKKPFVHAESQIQLWRSIEWIVMTPLIVAAAMSFVNIGLNNSKHTKLVDTGADFHTTIGTVVFYSTMVQVLYFMARQFQAKEYMNTMGVLSKFHVTECTCGYSVSTFATLACTLAAAALTGIFVDSIDKDYYTKLGMANSNVADRGEVSKLLLYSVGIRMVVQLVWLLHADLAWVVYYACFAKTANEANDYNNYLAISSYIIVCHEIVMFALDSIGRVGLLYMIMKDIPGGL